MNKLLIHSFLFIFIIIILISILGCSIPYDYQSFGINPDDIYINDSGFAWPVPNKYYISSYFGYRNLDLKGSSSYHSGIDIPGPEGTYFIAAMDGKVTYTGFSGSRRLYNNYRQ